MIKTITMKTLRAFSAFCWFLLPFTFAKSQSSLIPKYEVGIHAGVFVYQGDLTPNQLGAFNTMKPGFGISGTRNLSRSLALRLQLMRGRLKGDDGKYKVPAWRQQRNFNFKTPVTELSGQVLWHLTGLNPNEAGIINFSPYIFAGVGISLLKIKRDWSRFNTSHFAAQTSVLNGLAADINRAVPKTILVVPVGAGVRYGISEKLSFTLEASYRLTGADYLDGFSQAANPDRNDHYHSLTVGLIYSFGKRNRFDCPVIRN
jgi:hypothetical protein